MKRFVPKQRRALDGLAWWCIWDNKRRQWSTYTHHGKYKTRRAAEIALAVLEARGI